MYFLSKVPDARLGEEICVWVKLKAGSTMTEKELKQFCQGAISQFKIPRYIKFVDEFPINANQKIMKIKMQEITINELKLKLK